MNRKSQIFLQINSVCVKSGGTVNGLHAALFVRLLSGMTIDTLPRSKIRVPSISHLLSAWDVKWLDSYVCFSFLYIEARNPCQSQAVSSPSFAAEFNKMLSLLANFLTATKYWQVLDNLGNDHLQCGFGLLQATT